MRQQLARISVHQTAKVVAIVYALLGLLVAPLFILGSLFDPDETMSLWLALVLPVLYGVFGYIFTAIGCALYNAIASRFGGIEFTLSQSSES